MQKYAGHNTYSKVNNLLQKLKYVKRVQCFLAKHKFNIIHNMCDNFTTISWVLCKIQLIKFEWVKSETTKMEFRLKSPFQ